ncbi:MAG: NAD-dependent epimerase/dehydratase family protein [Steroidobacteraceae bacterium]
MRVAVTGAAGYIGRRLVERLSAAGHEIVAFDRNHFAGASATAFVRCDLTDPSSYETSLAGIDCICHLAAAKGDWGISEGEYLRDNYVATRELVAAARRAGINRWIFYSTVAVLGPSETPLDERAPRRPVNPYGASKAACEALYESYTAETPGASVLTIRPSVVFGPENPWNTNIFRLIDAIHRNRFVMIGSGREVKSASYIDNLLDAHMFLMLRQLEQPNTGVQIVHYVDEPGETTATLVRRIYSQLGRKPRKLRLSLALALPIALVGDAAASLLGIDLPITSARVRKFCTATNFSAQRIREQGFIQRVSNDEAIRLTVQWYLTDYLAAAGSRRRHRSP